MFYRNSFFGLCAAAALVFGVSTSAMAGAPGDDDTDEAPAGAASSVQAASAEEEEGPNRGRLSIGLNNDFTTAYFFRGIMQERDGLIWQPALDLSLNLYSGEGALTSVDAGFGIWMSYQTEETLAASEPEALYEIDYYPSLTLGWAGGISTSLTYYWYTSGNGGFDTVQQLDFAIAWDDSEVLGPFAFGPTATFSFETDRTSFGDKKGGYFEFAGAPGLEVPLCEQYPLAISFPFVLGLSMYDYYETPTEDDAFGYASLGLDLSIPLAFIPEDFGSWSVTAGGDVLFLSDTLEAANNGDDIYGIFTGSIAMEY